MENFKNKLCHHFQREKNGGVDGPPSSTLWHMLAIHKSTPLLLQALNEQLSFT